MLRLDTGIIARRMSVEFEYFEDSFDEGLATVIKTDSGQEVRADGRRVRVRLPTSPDLLRRKALGWFGLT